MNSWAHPCPESFGCSEDWPLLSFLNGYDCCSKGQTDLGRLVGLEGGPDRLQSPKLLTLPREGHSELVANVLSFKK